MKDVEKTTLRAFCLALYQQQPGQPLPTHVLTTLQEVAQDLSNRIIDLDQLAKNTPALAEPYGQARQWLTRQAAERGMGCDFLADEADDHLDQERVNVAREISGEDAALQQFLASIDEPTAFKIFIDPNPIQAIQAQAGSEQT